MATGRTLSRWARVYINGYDFSGYTRGIGPLTHAYPEVEITALSDAVKGALMGQPEISPGTLTGIFDNTATSGLHTVLNAPGSLRDMMVAVGIRAVPAEGDQVFMGSFNQNSYDTSPSGDDIALTLEFGKTSPAEGMKYEQPWGVLLHENSAETGANTAVGVDDFGAASTTGGFMMYQILDYEGTGSVVITVQEASSNENAQFAGLTTATSGSIAHTAMPCAGIIQCETDAAVKQYLRWQIALTTLTSVTFVLGFVRGR